MGRAGAQAPSDVRYDLAHWPGSADVEQQRAERCGTPRHPRLLAVVRKTKGGAGCGVEPCRRAGTARSGGNSGERSDVGRGGEKNGGGAKGWHARRMRRGTPITDIASTRMQSNVAS